MRRRTFLQTAIGLGLTATLAGCADNSGDRTEPETSADTPTESPEDTRGESTPEGTPTEEEGTQTENQGNVTRPTNYRWDMKPGRNDALRNELSQYISGSVGGVVQDHPAFDHATDSERDDHEIDFEALKLYRDSNFDIMAADPNYDAPMERAVQAFVDDSIFEEAKTSNFIQNDDEAPTSYDSESWLNADTLEESLDLGHNFLISLAYTPRENISIKEQAATIREAYQRHHDFEVLAWEVPMRDGAQGSGMMYSPDDDKVRTFNVGGAWSGDGESQIHSEIQDWRVISNEDNVGRGGQPENFHHPVLFHTDEWDREGVSFEDAKDFAVGSIFGIANDAHGDYNNDAFGITQEITMTTGATEQLTRTLLDYNKSGVDADFEDIRNLANFAVGKYIDDPELNGVIDTVEPGDDNYDEYFGGSFAFYEVEDEEIVDEVRTDQSHEYDNFGEVYDQLEAV